MTASLASHPPPRAVYASEPRASASSPRPIQRAGLIADDVEVCNGQTQEAAHVPLPCRRPPPACLIRFGQPLDPARERGRPPGDAKLGCKVDAVDPPRIT